MNKTTASVLHISDPHFGTELAHVASALTRLAKAQAPDLLILSGDITQRARRKQFRAAHDFVQQLGIEQRLVIPGNHDIALLNLAERIFLPYASFSKVFGPKLEPVFENDALLIIALNTTRRYRHVDGEVSMRQIARVESLLLQAKPSQLRIVVTHQPVSVLHAQDEQDLLHRHAEAVVRWTEAGVDLILGGHIHLPYVCALQEQYPHLSRPSWAVQAGTCISSRLRHEAGNSVNLIRYDSQLNDSLQNASRFKHSRLTSPSPEHETTTAAKESAAHRPIAASRCCQIERWDYQDSTASFERVSTHILNGSAAHSSVPT